MTKDKPKERPHYVNNKIFSEAVMEYVIECNEAKKAGLPRPIVTNYIAECFLKIAEGLANRSNFHRYSYKSEMVMDAVENCLKAIENYNIDKATRTGKPNAFAYFTQLSWFAFLRRIQKEKKQQDIKLKYLAESDLMHLIAAELDDDEAIRQTQFFVDSLRERIDVVKETDKAVAAYGKEVRKKRRRRADSDLSDFLEEDDS